MLLHDGNENSSPKLCMSQKVTGAPTMDIRTG